MLLLLLLLFFFFFFFVVVVVIDIITIIFFCTTTSSSAASSSSFSSSSVFIEGSCSFCETREDNKFIATDIAMILDLTHLYKHTPINILSLFPSPPPPPSLQLSVCLSPVCLSPPDREDSDRPIDVHDPKTYLKTNIDNHLKFVMTRFRLGISEVNVHHYRYKRHTDNDLICPLCSVVPEP